MLTCIGGTTPDKRDLISGSGNSGAGSFSTSGIMIDGGLASTTGKTVQGNTVQGNLIGNDKSGTVNLGNGGAGVLIATSGGNTVGGVDDLNNPERSANTIAFNGLDGVAILFDSSTGNRILSNSIFSNRGLGIDLDGGTEVNNVTANDNKKKDSYTGPNNLQNYPFLASATHAVSTGTNTIKGKLKSRPRRFFTIQFFRNTSVTDQDKTFIGEITVKTNRKGSRSFTFIPPCARRRANRNRHGHEPPYRRHLRVLRSQDRGSGDLGSSEG